MRWMIFSPLLLFAQIPHDLNLGLRGLQQIRSLVSERMYNEEFSVIIDRPAFAKQLKDTSFSMEQPGIPSVEKVCRSSFYLSRFVVSGEPVRLLDTYQEFEYGPYWLYPTPMHKLYDMRNQKSKP